MTIEIQEFLLSIIAILFIAAIYIVSILWVYKDAQKRFIYQKYRIIIWTMIATVPIAGITAYWFIKYMDEGFQLSSLPFIQRTNQHETLRERVTGRRERSDIHNISPQQVRQTRPRGQPQSESYLVSTLQRTRPRGQARRQSATNHTRPAQMTSSSTQANTSLQITVINGQGRFRTKPLLSSGQIFIGREASQCDFVIQNDDTVSRRHIHLDISDEQITMFNLSEHSGTWLNGQRLMPKESRRLVVGDKISIGETTVIIQNIATNNPVQMTRPAQRINEPRKYLQVTIPPSYRLRVDEGKHRGKIFSFDMEQLPIMIGRTSKCQVYLGKDKSVSREHAQLLKKSGKLFIQDLNSQYGTRVNGRGIHERDLISGDIIRIGESKLIIEEVQ